MRFAVKMSDTRKVTYLLVEDDATQAELLTKWLKKVAQPQEIEVVTAGTLADGLRISRELRPNATFLDLHLPGTTWEEVADAIPQFVCRAVIVIAITGEPDPDHRIEFYCISKGAQNFFTKPFDESFFAKLKGENRIFASELLKAAASAQLRAELGPRHDDGTG